LTNKEIKRTTITRAGYEYQDLVGIEVLIDFYRNPDKYTWVKLEAEDKGNSLDDVIAARANGSFDYIQVKFTVDSSDYPLDWKWLTEKSKHGTSMLAKWAKSLRDIHEKGRVNSAELRTNRVPSPDITACLKNNRIDLEKVSEEDRDLLIRECGGATEAEDFFREFLFRHSLLDLDGLESQLRDLLVPTDLEPNGWLFLREQVRTWTMRRDRPSKEGKVLHEHLLQVISRQRPQPISQDFRIPPDYILPSRSFDRKISKRIAAGASTTIVWGSPGRGKSTYLSFLTKKLRKKGAAIIRHHYFLALEDTTPDRMSFSTITSSLINQLFVFYPEFTTGEDEKTAELRPLLEKISQRLLKKNERLYVVIDGLDHVWRDTSKVDQLDHLFNHLMPVPKNVSLIVGTQPVEHHQLPKKLVRMSKERDWFEIPAMDEVAVTEWVRAQDHAKRLLVAAANPDHRKETVDAIAASFFRISQGHPLHLIYAFESLCSTNKPIREDDVDRLTACPDGDIRTYYSTLWNGLSNDAKKILHALAGTGFHWPGFGIRKCFGTFDEVAFLLQPKRAGYVPFHGSLFAYVRDRSDHEENLEILLRSVVSWLEHDAPEFWRWGWLWLTKQKAGDSDDLLNKTTRAWVVGSLAAGWSDRQIVTILTAAEWAAFETENLPRIVELRWLKVRVQNAREFQSTDFAGFEAAAIGAHANRQQLYNLLDDLSNLTEKELEALPSWAPAELEREVRDACSEELGRRINAWLELRHRPAQEFTALSKTLLRVATNGDKKSRDRVLNFTKCFHDPKPYQIEYIVGLGKAANIDALDALRARFRTSRSMTRKTLQDELARTAGYLGIDLASRMKRPTGPISPMLACWYLLRDKNLDVQLLLPPAPKALDDDSVRYGRDPGLAPLLHSIFFSALASSLMSDGDYSFLYPGLNNRENIGWLATAINALETLARSLANGQIELSFSAPFLVVADVEEVKFRGNSNEADHRRYIVFRNTLRLISRDLHMISQIETPGSLISLEDFELARSSVHWIDLLWLTDDIADRRRMLEQDAARGILNDCVTNLSNSVTVFNERADTWSELLQFSKAYSLGNERELAERSADCHVAYGYHKDLSGADVLVAIQEAHRGKKADSLAWLRAVTPVVDRITDFTDGDETDHVQSTLIEVVAQTHPEKLQEYYAHFVEAEEWRYADECIEEFVNIADFNSAPLASLASTFLDHHTVGSLKKASMRDEHARELYKRQLEFLAGEPVNRRDRSGNDSLGPLKPLSKKISKFKADEFAKVAAQVSDNDFDYRNREKFLTDWLEFWVNKSKGKDALSSINDYFSSGAPTIHVEEILDHAFLASLKIEGKASAYKWIVRAHIQRSGWSSYWTSNEETVQRLEWVAKYYPEKWMEFIKDSSESRRYNNQKENEFFIGLRYLVKFLMLVGQDELAAQITKSLVSLFVADVTDQPLEDALWLS